MSLGETVTFYLAAILPELRETFGFQDATLPILASTQVYRRSSNDIEEWVTPVTLQVTCKHIWREAVIAPKLRELRLNMGLSNEGAAPTLSSRVLYDGRR